MATGIITGTVILQVIPLSVQPIAIIIITGIAPCIIQMAAGVIAQRMTVAGVVTGTAATGTIMNTGKCDYIAR